MNVKRRLKILFVPSGDKIAPATRYRIYQLLPFLEKEGIDYTVYSILSEAMTVRMVKSSTYNGFQKALYYIQAAIEKFIRTWRTILLAKRYDLIFLQRTTFPLGLERLLKMRNKNIIFDIDDSIYLPDKKEGGLTGWIKRDMKKREVVSVLRISECAIVSNNYIKNFVQQYCDKTYRITGPIDILKNYVKDEKPGPKEIIIGWIGTPSTTPYLKMLDGVLQQLSKKYKIKVRLIGASLYSVDGVDIEAVTWSEETEVPELHKFDIGIMAMPDNEWTRGKVGIKMLQYMANAIPAVVSYTPTTIEIIEDGINGFLAGSEEEWIKKISLLIENPELMERMGKAGRRTVEEKFAVEVSVPRYLGIFKDCIRLR